MDLHHEFESSKFFNRARIDRRAADAGWSDVRIYGCHGLWAA